MQFILQHRGSTNSRLMYYCGYCCHATIDGVHSLLVRASRTRREAFHYPGGQIARPCWGFEDTATTMAWPTMTTVLHLALSRSSFRNPSCHKDVDHLNLIPCISSRPCQWPLRWVVSADVCCGKQIYCIYFNNLLHTFLFINLLYIVGYLIHFCE